MGLAAEEKLAVTHPLAFGNVYTAMGAGEHALRP